MAISLNDHEKRIKDFEGQISSINSKITTLENKPPAKDWAIVRVNLDRHGDGYFDEKYINHKKRLCAYYIEYYGSDRNGRDFSGRAKMEDLVIYGFHNSSNTVVFKIFGNKAKLYCRVRPGEDTTCIVDGGYVELLCYT